MTVTEAAMRPASDKRACFYCHQPIGEQHAADCGLVQKRVKVRMTVYYNVEVPAHWDADMIEFHRNDSSWCASNALEELEALGDKLGCICSNTTFKYIATVSEPFLSED